MFDTFYKYFQIGKTIITVKEVWYFCVFKDQ